MDIEKVLEIVFTRPEKAVEIDGWVYSPRFNHFQKVNKGVYAYVTPQMFGRWIVQMYEKGATGICSLEARLEPQSKNEISKLFELGEQWLNQYGDSLEDIEKNRFYPFHKDGWSGKLN